MANNLRWTCPTCYMTVLERNINRHKNNDTHKILSGDTTNLRYTYKTETIEFMKEERDRRKDDPTIHENFVKQEQERYKSIAKPIKKTDREKLMNLQKNSDKLVKCLFCNQEYKQNYMSKHRKTKQHLENFNKNKENL